MKTALLLAALLIALSVSSRAEDDNAARQRQKHERLKEHTTATETAAYKSDGVASTAFKPTEILAFHASRVATFIGTEGMGISRIPRMERTPRIFREESGGPRRYTATSQELIGIDMHESPVAYQANYIIQTLSGRKKDNALEKTRTEQVPERKLDDFETAALQILKSGRDIVIDEKPGKLRVVGAIRASGDCLACHTSCKERDLLGAFTYVLTPPSRDDFRLSLQQRQAEIQLLLPQTQVAVPPKPVVQESTRF